MTTSPERVAEALRASLKESERLRLQNRRLVDAASEPIAIVGMSCRYPGAGSPDALWRLLAGDGDAISAFPTDRGWDLDNIFDRELEGFDGPRARSGGFLEDAADFDPEFFGISPREALGMDPQQRLALEASWEALEDAGIDPSALRGTRGGVFTGAMYHDYGWGLSPAQGSAAYLSTGGSSSLISGRVAYTLGLEGPALSVDTACSSSLVALHLATRALREGECSLALAGGVTVYSTPGVFVQFSRQRVLSPQGRCRAYAESADGAGFAEGVGMLVLERLGEARRRGHAVLATIRGSAVNQDGASNGITAPNGPAQEMVIRQALENARLGAEEVDAIEGHGTGTMLGDPIEANALLATYGAERPRDRPLRLGSLKSNIGHAQAAAGVGGVIKMVLALREGVLPRTLHVDAPSSKVDWSSGAIELLTEPAPWQPGEQPRRAGVSSFGATGTNAHLILEEAPPLDPVEEETGGSDSQAEGSPIGGTLLLPLSAKTEPALRQAAGRLAAHLRQNPGLSPAAVGHSLARGRARLEQRAVVLGGDRVELLEGLAALQRGEGSLALARGRAGGKSAVAFLFPGQGSQWPGMGAQLLSESVAFQRSLEQCDEALSGYLDWSVCDVVRGAEGAPSIERIEIVQPVLFAVTVALAELWRACGVQPAAVAGHSQGEIAAAHIAGGLSLGDAARLAALRSRIIAKLTGQGAMASIALPSARVASLVEPWGGQVEVAAQNGPSSTIVAAGREALEGLLAQCEAEGVRAREVPATIPSHSAQVEPLRDELLDALAPISPRSGDVPFYSTVSGEPVDTAELGPEYWYDNLRQPVRFEAVTRRLLKQGYRVLVEVSPHPVFALAVGETIEDALGDTGEATVLGTLRRDEGGAGRFALSLAEAHVAGVELDWDALFSGSSTGHVPLPTYPFQRKRFWLSSAEGRGDVGAAGLADAEHPLLGAVIQAPSDGGCALSGRLSLADHSWLADHAVAGTVLLPGTAFLELALRAAQEVGAEAIEELTLQAPMLLPQQGAVQVQVAASAADDQGRSEVSIYSRAESGDDDDPEWICHAQGILTAVASPLPEPLGSWPPAGAEPLEVESLYDRLAEAGFEYGPAFQGVAAAWRAADEIYVEARLAVEQAQEAQGFALHPALLDSGGHPGIDLFLAAREGASGEAVLPFAWRGVSVYARGASVLRLRLVAGEQGGGLDAYDELGAPVASVDSVVMRPVDPAMLRAAANQLPLHRTEWVGVEPGPTAAPRLAILGESEVEGLEAGHYPDLPALLEAIAGGAPAPEVLLVDERAASGKALPAAAHARARRTLELAQSFLAAEELQGCRFCLLTAGAVAARESEDPELASAPLWGLLRSAHSEHPGRFVLVDTDGTSASGKALATVLGAGAVEPQIALREGEALVPRLTRIDVPEEPAATPIDPARTVLITGGTSGIGTLLARHLVAEHGARHLLLVSRRGSEAAGVGELVAELRERGAEVTVAACDVADRAALETLLGSIPSEHPLGAVFHSAAVLDDGVLEALDAERLERVMRPKVDAAWHLHELTAGAELSAFVLFSSVMGVLGSAAQANYAAANVFLDALASHRRAAGLPASALAWGGWAQQSRLLDGSQDGAAIARLVEQVRKRLGLVPMPPEQALAMLDAALALPSPELVPVAFDGAVLRAQAGAGTLPAILRGLVRLPSRREREQGSLAGRLAAVPEAERPAVVLDLVRGHVADVLGYASPAEVEPERAFRDLGFDSLAAVELRNRLVAATGLRIAPTIVFDYPSPASLAEYLRGEATGGAAGVAAPRAAAASAEPVAIVGMACRYPGDASSPAALWELLAAGRDAIAGFPEDRGWDLERLYSPDPDEPGTCYSREGGFVPDSADFDPGFFGISPREALMMDPQERVLLEACWEALEDGAVDPRRLRGTETGVFAGAMYRDYGVADYGMGMTSAGISGRVAYTLGLEGPTMTVDTACSSSLVAIHLAAQSLRSGECSLALAGGATVLATPGVLTFFARQRGLAADGRSKAFSESADGTSIAEGTGVVLLERLSEARRNGHRVLATIRGSAVNQDGASNGFTAPNGPSQERVIRQALANAGLSPEDVDAVEAHGTGTALGDPIEAGALLATYGQGREAPLKLGSLKSNIGHTQAAAGVGGVIKMVMAMGEGVLPRTLHADQPSSKVDWGAGRIKLLNEAQPWERAGRPRRAGVSSFGASGTNAHLVLEEAAPAESEQQAPEDTSGPPEPARSLPGPLLLPFSAKTEPALAELAARLHSHLSEDPALDPASAAYSLATARAALDRRAVVIGRDREQLLEGLAAVRDGGEAGWIARGRARQGGKLAYLFTGQGSQRPGMGRELYETYPAFAEAFDRAGAELDAHLDVPLRDLVFDQGEEAAERLEDTTYAQPALFATEVATFGLLESLGLYPDLLAGHSIGELSAAHLAGVFSLADAARLVAARGRLMGALPGGGAMLAVQASEQEVADAIRGEQAEIAIAAINGPTSLVLSGAGPAIAAAEQSWGAAGRKTKRLAVSHAFHSPLIDPILAEFETIAGELEYHEPRIPLASNLTGGLLSAEQATDPAYWVSHARQPVRFMEAVRTLRQLGATAFLELGPEAVLSAMAHACAEAEDAEAAARSLFVPTQRAGQPEAATLALAVGRAHCEGVELDWERHFAAAAVEAIPLPTYPFQRQRYWFDSVQTEAGDPASAGQAATAHPLLGASIAVAGGEQLLLTGRVSLRTHPWLADHALGGVVLLPGTAMVELALRAGREVGMETLEELTLQAPLVLPEDGAVQLQVGLGGPDEDGRREVEIHARPEAGDDEVAPGGWICHARGTLTAEPLNSQEAPASWPPEGAEPLEVGSIYERLADHGIEYGPAFQAVRAAWRLDGELFAELALSEEHAPDAARFGLHPALFDAAGHAGVDLVLAAEPDGGEGPGQLALPFAWRGVSIASVGATSLRVRADLQGGGLVAFDPAGSMVASVDSLTLRPLELDRLPAAARRLPLHRVEWIEVGAGSANGSDPPRLAVLGDAPLDGLAAERYADLAALLAAIEAGADLPEIVIAAIESSRGDEDLIPLAHARAEQTLELLQTWLATEQLAESRLCLQTAGAVAAGGGEESPDLGSAALWGLLRSAQSEHPGRFALLDVDGEPVSSQVLAAALARTGGEAQVALRAGRVLAPRLSRVEAGEPESVAPRLDPGSTVLITGGLGGLGAVLARHLAAEHGARHLLLVSRRGGEADGVGELLGELEGLGAEASAVACDVSDRAQLETLLDSIPAEQPLGAVIHSAGVVEDGLLESLDAGQLDRVFAAKVDAAWHLHELTAQVELSHFVMFSSVAGIVGTPGQANYAAANSFLDALASHRAAAGLPALSLAWGVWGQATGMTGGLGDADVSRIRRLGLAPISPRLGLDLFDAACTRTDPLLAPVALDAAGLRAQAAAATLPAILSGLVGPVRGGGEQRSLARQLAGVSVDERERLVLELVRGHVAAVLGHASAGEIDPEAAFMDLGFDSLAAVELRNRLNAATGLRLQPTIVFDYPSAAAVAQHLLEQVGAGLEPGAEGNLGKGGPDEALARLTSMLPALKADEQLRDRVGDGLRALLADLSAPAEGEGEELASMSHEEMFELIDEEFGAS